jgi:hypothetical protein
MLGTCMGLRAWSSKREMTYATCLFNFIFQLKGEWRVVRPRNNVQATRRFLAQFQATRGFLKS